MITYGGSSRAVKLVANVKIACMKTHSPNRALSKTRNGFALVVTLSLMILLTVIAVGLLSLSTISLRASGASADVAVARSNARMALMLALGDLQKHAGLDTRVTARADILDEKNPPVVGVWTSWEGSDHDDSGRPISPGDYRQTKEFFILDVFEICWGTSLERSGLCLFRRTYSLTVLLYLLQP